jgi:hypothetical protein
VLQVLQDETLRQRLEAAARAFVERECSWTPLMERFASLVEAVGRNN